MPTPIWVAVRPLGTPALAVWEQLLARRAAPEQWSILVQEASVRLTPPPHTTLYQLAPECPCCAGQLALRTFLARILRHDRPAAILLELSGSAHLEQVYDLLSGPSFSVHLDIRQLDTA